MSFVFTIFLFILFAAGSGTLIYFSWTKESPYLWIGTFVTNFVAKAVFSAIARGYATKLVLMSDAAIKTSHYGQYSIVCAFFIFVFIILTIISIVLLVGQLIIKRQERPY